MSPGRLFANTLVREDRLRIEAAVNKCLTDRPQFVFTEDHTACRETARAVSDFIEDRRAPLDVPARGLIGSRQEFPFWRTPEELATHRSTTVLDFLARFNQMWWISAYIQAIFLSCILFLRESDLYQSEVRNFTRVRLLLVARYPEMATQHPATTAMMGPADMMLYRVNIDKGGRISFSEWEETYSAPVPS